MKIVESSGLKLIGGIPNTSKDVKKMIEDTEVPISPDSFFHKSRTVHIYAIRTTCRLFNENRSVVVYANQERRTSKINDQNEVLAYIGERLNALSEKGKDWSEARLHKAIDGIVGSWKDYIHTGVKRKGTGPRIELNFKKHQIALSERLHGRYLLFSSDESLTSAQFVKAYFEKDFVEKV